MRAWPPSALVGFVALQLLIGSTLRAQAVGSSEGARPVAGHPGIVSMVVIDRPELRARDFVEPGAMRRLHSHDDVAWHVITLVTGQQKLTIEGDAPIDVARGQVVHLEGDATHTFANAGSVTATIIEVFGKAALPK